MHNAHIQNDENNVIETSNNEQSSNTQLSRKSNRVKHLPKWTKD